MRRRIFAAACAYATLRCSSSSPPALAATDLTR